MQVKTFRPLFPDLSQIDDLATKVLEIKEDVSSPSGLPYYKKASQPGYIVYSIQSEELKGSGIVCLTNIQDYATGNILTHENTLEEKEIRQFNLISKRGSVIKPVLLTYPNIEWFDEFLETLKTEKNKLYNYFFEDRDQLHTFWMITEPEDVNKITNFFNQELLKVYIADGHHRFSTFSRYGNIKNSGIPPWLLSVYLPFNALKIYEFNRIFNPGVSIDKSGLLTKLKEFCFIEKLDYPIPPQFKYNFLILNKKKVWSCVWRPSILEKYKTDMITLDVSLINQIIFTGIFGVKDIRTDTRIGYTEGYKGWEGIHREVSKVKHQIGFYLFPVSFEDFQQVAEKDMVLPPKSTWFEPRIRNGLLIHEFEEND